MLAVVDIINGVVRLGLCDSRNTVIIKMGLSQERGAVLGDIVKLKYKEDLKMLAGFTLLDDDFMTIVFDRNIEATEFVLNIILGRNDLKVIEVVAQREYKNPVMGGRSIKLDIYAEDFAGKVYDIEVQNDDAGADIHRARFHSSMLDTKMLIRLPWLKGFK